MTRAAWRVYGRHQHATLNGLPGVVLGHAVQGVFPVRPVLDADGVPKPAAEEPPAAAASREQNAGTVGLAAPRAGAGRPRSPRGCRHAPQCHQAALGDAPARAARLVRQLPAEVPELLGLRPLPRCQVPDRLGRDREGACRHLVNDRLGITGARWRMRGAEAVLRLRALRCSGDFDEYWQFHEAQEWQRTHRQRYADGQVPTLRHPNNKPRRAPLSQTGCGPLSGLALFSSKTRRCSNSSAAFSASSKPTTCPPPSASVRSPSTPSSALSSITMTISPSCPASPTGSVACSAPSGSSSWHHRIPARRSAPIGSAEPAGTPDHRSSECPSGRNFPGWPAFGIRHRSTVQAAARTRRPAAPGANDQDSRQALPRTPPSPLHPRHQHPGCASPSPRPPPDSSSCTLVHQ